MHLCVCHYKSQNVLPYTDIIKVKLPLVSIWKNPTWLNEALNLLSHLQKPQSYSDFFPSVYPDIFFTFLSKEIENNLRERERQV